TEEIQVLSGHNLEAKVLGSGFPLPTPDDHNDNQSKYRKSGWNLNNTPKMPGSLLAFDCDNSTLLTPRMDVGMWHFQLIYSSRIWYGVPSKYHQKCEALLKKTFPELSGHRELFHKLVSTI
ncbi:hypothetical protein Tco_1560529, partial [Tanacetum coccineum]